MGEESWQASYVNLASLYPLVYGFMFKFIFHRSSLASLKSWTNSIIVGNNITFLIFCQALELQIRIEVTKTIFNEKFRSFDTGDVFSLYLI